VHGWSVWLINPSDHIGLHVNGYAAQKTSYEWFSQFGNFGVWLHVIFLLRQCQFFLFCYYVTSSENAVVYFATKNLAVFFNISQFNEQYWRKPSPTHLSIWFCKHKYRMCQKSAVYFHMLNFDILSHLIVWTIMSRPGVGKLRPAHMWLILDWEAYIFPNHLSTKKLTCFPCKGLQWKKTSQHSHLNTAIERHCHQAAAILLRQSYYNKELRKWQSDPENSHARVRYNKLTQNCTTVLHASPYDCPWLSYKSTW